MRGDDDDDDLDDGCEERNLSNRVAGDEASQQHVRDLCTKKFVEDAFLYALRRSILLADVRRLEAGKIWLVCWHILAFSIHCDSFGNRITVVRLDLWK